MQKKVKVEVTGLHDSNDRQRLILSEKEEVIAKAIIANMSNEMKEQYYNILISHDKGIKAFRNGEFLTIPSIEIKFTETGRVVLDTER